MNIAIVGSGYVGLLSGVCFAHIRYNVICIDNNAAKIKTLMAGKVPIYEPGLEELLKKYTKSGRITFSTSIAEGAKESQGIFIAVGTPSKKNGDTDLTYTENVAREVAKHMDFYKLLVEKSTVPALTGDTIRLILQARKRIDQEFDVVSNPEFLREGSAVEDFMNPDRVVIGVESKRAERLLRDIYKPLKAIMVVTNLSTAEAVSQRMWMRSCGWLRSTVMSLISCGRCARLTRSRGRRLSARLKTSSRSSRTRPLMSGGWRSSPMPTICAASIDVIEGRRLPYPGVRFQGHGQSQRRD